MSSDLFKNLGINVGKLVNDNLGASLLPATLTKVTQGARDVNDPTAGPTESTTDYSARGFIDNQDRRNLDGTLVDDGTKVVVLLGESISGGVVPTPADRVTIEGTLYSIENVDRDPASATYPMTVRPR
jgi:hypothetical protein